MPRLTKKNLIVVAIDYNSTIVHCTRSLERQYI